MCGHEPDHVTMVFHSRRWGMGALCYRSLRVQCRARPVPFAANILHAGHVSRPAHVFYNRLTPRPMVARRRANRPTTPPTHLLNLALRSSSGGAGRPEVSRLALQTASASTSPTTAPSRPMRSLGVDQNPTRHPLGPLLLRRPAPLYYFSRKRPRSAGGLRRSLPPPFPSRRSPSAVPVATAHSPTTPPGSPSPSSSSAANPLRATSPINPFALVREEGAVAQGHPAHHTRRFRVAPQAAFEAAEPLHERIAAAAATQGPHLGRKRA